MRPRLPYLVDSVPSCSESVGLKTEEREVDSTRSTDSRRSRSRQIADGFRDLGFGSCQIASSRRGIGAGYRWLPFMLDSAPSC